MIQDIYIKTYYKLVGRSAVLRPIRLITRTLANIHLRYALKLNSSKYTCSGNNSDVIVSLTSFPARINNLWIVIESLLRQSVRPQKILIWLSEEQFANQSIPQSLICLNTRGVEIKWVDKNIKSHKKYYYVFQEYPNSLILLADDDIIYPSDMLEKLTNMYFSSKHDKRIAHMYGYKMKYNYDGTLKPYNTWEVLYSQSEGHNLFFGSGGGTLLRPKDLYNEVTNIKLARLLAPQADDVWLNAMARLAGCYYYKLPNGPILSVQNKNNETLANSNLSESQNDVQIKNVISYYLKVINKDPFLKYEE